MYIIADWGCACGKYTHKSLRHLVVLMVRVATSVRGDVSRLPPPSSSPPSMSPFSNFRRFRPCYMWPWPFICCHTLCNALPNKYCFSSFWYYKKLYNVVFIEPIYRQQRVSMFAGKEHTTSHTHIYFPIKHITIRSPFTQRRTFIDKHCCRVLQLTY